ncbi:F0F1 ATP synthase subunit B [Lapidilactobacillus mulanensis]|uniref:ATP synthase subunit b n=1 Tax=Lapidilactobacillus mulanensis TaxID=2485999 RepID=A0ABW4DNM2_9LACO
MNGSVIAAIDVASLGDSLFLLVVFILLLLLVKHFAWGPVTKMMDDRAKKINADLDGAETSRAQAEKMAAQRQSELKNSKSEAIQIVNTAKVNGEKRRQVILDAAQSDAESVKTKAREDAQQARTEALNSARNDVAQISVDIAEKLIGKELSVSDQKDLIDAYIKGLTSADETR